MRCLSSMEYSFLMCYFVNDIREMLSVKNQEVKFLPNESDLPILNCV